MAVALLAGWVGIAIRYRLRSTLVMGALILGPPGFGFALYALFPGPLPVDDAVVFLFALLYLTSVLAVIFQLLRPRRSKSKPTVHSVKSLSRAQVRGFIIRSVVVLWLSALVYLFEPSVAAVNIAINGAWMLIWIPRKLRTARYETSAEISASPERVFTFVTDPGNWPLYREDTELISLAPEGPLRLGTEYVSRNKVPARLQRGAVRQFDSRNRVTAFEPPKSYTWSVVDLASNDSRLEFEPMASGGTCLNLRSELEMTYLEACSGSMLNIPAVLAIRRASDAGRFARLKSILEAAPDQ